MYTTHPNSYLNGWVMVFFLYFEENLLRYNKIVLCMVLSHSLTVKIWIFNAIQLVNFLNIRPLMWKAFPWQDVIIIVHFLQLSINIRKHFLCQYSLHIGSDVARERQCWLKSNKWWLLSSFFVFNCHQLFVLYASCVMSGKNTYSQCFIMNPFLS